MNQNQIALIEARAYAIERPQTTASQLRERFQVLSIWQCRRVMDAARKKIRKSGGVVKTEKARNSDPLYQLAKSYGMENPAVTPGHLRSLYAITETQSRFIVRVAREVVRKAKKEPTRKISSKQAAAMADAARRRQEAADYVRQNPNVYPSVVAKLFRVPSPELTKLRKAEQQRIAAESKASNPNQQRRKLCAIFNDGSIVDPKRVKKWDGFTRFERVAV
jgi:hypothetical protein